MARYALIIGIGEYQGRGFANLSKATNDAEAVAQLLEEYGDFHAVERLPKRWNSDKNKFEVAKQKVTGTELRLALKTFLLEKAAKNEAVIYFTGHGFTVSDGFGKPKGYLAASDCQVDLKENQVVDQKYGVDFIGFNDLIEESDLSSLVVLLDCCHSGTFLESEMVRQTMTAFSLQKNYWLIAACRSYEEALALKTDAHSIFTGALLKGLGSENTNRKGEVTGAGLFDYISSEVNATLQEPIHLGWGDSITLVTYSPEDITREEVSFNRENPYRGLYPFESQQEKYFCGREQAIRALLDRINSNRFLAVIGSSGCGKSSLVKAGLLPHLERDRLPGSSQWGIETFTPGKHPLGKLIEILDRQHKQNQPFVIFIDQMEEIFTLCEDEAERQSFIHLIADEVTTSDRLTRVIVAIRTDFLDRCAAYSEAASLINRTQPTTYVVPPLSRPELEEAIKEPASLHGVKFERGLISQIADDVDDQPGALPLLQYALKELWRVCIEKPNSPEPRLTWKGYKEIGGVKGALENRANLLYQSFASIDQFFVRRMFMQLVQLGEENQVTRRRASWERLEAIADSIDQQRRVVGLLADQRLIVTDEDTVEVAHEALLTEWTLLRGWIEENRENIRLSRLLEAECREWQVRFKKSESALLTGAKLATIAEWKEQNQPKIPVEEAEFLQKSLAKRDREIQEELEQERQLREAAEARAKAEAEKAEQERIAALAKIEIALEAEARAKAEAREAEAKAKFQKQRTQAVTFLAASVVAFVLFWTEAQRKEAQIAKIGEFKLLTALSETYWHSDNQLEALVTSVKALNKLREVDGKDVQALTKLQSVIYNVRERNRLEGHTEAVICVSFSPKEELIVSGSNDRTVRLWKIDGTPPKIIGKHKGKVWSVNFSPDGQYIVSSDNKGTVKLWTKNGNNIETITGHKGIVEYVVFNRDSNIIVSAGEDGYIKRWKITKNIISRKIYLKNLKPLLEKSRPIYSVNFSPNGQLIASAGDDGMIKIWDINANLLATIPASNDEEPIRYADFGPDNHSLISVSDDGTIRIWQWKNNPKMWKQNSNDISGRIVVKDTYRTYVVKFSPNGRFIAATTADGTVRIWRLDKNAIVSLDPLKKHQGQVNDLSFYNGQTLATASWDKTIRVWSLDYQNTANHQGTSNDLLKVACSYLKEYLNTHPNLKQNNPEICPQRTF